MLAPSPSPPGRGHPPGTRAPSIRPWERLLPLFCFPRASTMATRVGGDGGSGGPVTSGPHEAPRFPRQLGLPPPPPQQPRLEPEATPSRRPEGAGAALRTLRIGAGRGRGGAPLRAGGAPSTDLHSPAGVRPKFGHSLEHIVLRRSRGRRRQGKRARPAGSPLRLQAPRPYTARRTVSADGRRPWRARGRGSADASPRAASRKRLQPAQGRAGGGAGAAPRAGATGALSLRMRWAGALGRDRGGAGRGDACVSRSRVATAEPSSP